METVRICCSAATYSTIQAIFFFFSLGFRLQIHCCETKGGRQVLAATSTRLLDWSALNFNIGLLCTTSCRSRAHPFFNLGSHGHERLFYICGILCTGFQKRNSKRICKFLQMEKQSTVSSAHAQVHTSPHFLEHHWITHEFLDPTPHPAPVWAGLSGVTELPPFVALEPLCRTKQSRGSAKHPQEPRHTFAVV